MPFAEPKVLSLLLIVPALGLLLIGVRLRRRRLLRRFGREDLVARLVEAPGPGRWAARTSLVLSGATFLILTLARPQWGQKVEEVKRRGVDVMIALDISRSMLAEDVKPNRLIRAREEAVTLIEALGGDRVGLVAFAGTASVACPLTLDYSAARLFLDVLDPSYAPVPGTALAAAIRTANAAFDSKEKRYKVLVIITDGEDHEGQAEAAARQAAADGVVIYTLGVGSGAGAPIPERDERGVERGFKSDREGKVVTSRLDPLGLSDIARAGGGKYLAVTAEGKEIREIEERIARMERREVGSRFVITYEERFQIPLAVALLALAAEVAIGGRRFPRREEGRT